jgi:hypothetical protein
MELDLYPTGPLEVLRHEFECARHGMLRVPERGEAEFDVEFRDAGKPEERERERRGEDRRPAPDSDDSEPGERRPPDLGVARTARLRREEDEQRGQEREGQQERERHADRCHGAEATQREESPARERDERGHAGGGGEEARGEDPATRGEERGDIVGEPGTRPEMVSREVDAAGAADHEDDGCRSLGQLAALPAQQWKCRERQRCGGPDRREARHDRRQGAQQQQERQEQRAARADRDAHHRCDRIFVRGDPHGRLAHLMEAEARSLVRLEDLRDLLDDGEQRGALGRCQLDHDRADAAVCRDQRARPEGISESEIAQSGIATGPPVYHERRAGKPRPGC